jgi:hypothetical protein
MLRRSILLLSLAAAACDRDLERLEHDLASAQARLAELERAEKNAQSDEVDPAVDRRLPDVPRGALTATLAAFLASIPGAEFDGSLPEVTTGHVVTDPVVITLPAELPRLLQLFRRLKTLERMWQLDSVKKLDGSWLRVEIHGFNFKGGGAPAKLDLQVSPDEDGMFSADRDRVRAETRLVLAAIDKKLAELAAAGIDQERLAKKKKIELKRGIVADLADRRALIEKDAELILETLAEAQAIPLEMTIGLRMGRRVCSLALATEEDQTRVVTIATGRYGVATDEKQRELVMKGGRVCTLRVGLPPKGSRTP